MDLGEVRHLHWGLVQHFILPSLDRNSGHDTDMSFLVAVSAATDLYLSAYPAIVLFGLQLPLRKKLALTAALGIGSVYVKYRHLKNGCYRSQSNLFSGTVVGIYKSTRLPTIAHDDFSYDTADLVIWTW